MNFRLWLEMSVPAILYHGTMPSRLELIKKQGLLNVVPYALRKYPDFKHGVYLAPTPEDARYWAATKGKIDRIPSDGQDVVILAVKTANLDPELFKPDPTIGGCFIENRQKTPTLVVGDECPF